jgi:uncharacterized protein (DUF342 family)
MDETAHLKDLSLHFDGESRKVMASFTPEGDSEAISPDDLALAIEAAGFGGYHILKPALEAAATKYNAGEAFDLVVGEALDGQFSVRIDTSHMGVYLSYTPPLGGMPVKADTVLQETRKLGVVLPLDLEAIDKALLEGGDDVLISSGQPPVAGVDGRFESLIPSMKEKRPQIDEDGLTDFRDLGEIIVVQANEGLMRRILPTSGEPGKRVTGEAIPVKPGKSIAFSAKLDGVRVDQNDPNFLVAEISGCPVIVKNGVTVLPVHTVKDVDLHTGNISFIGSVHVTGDVHAGMSIKAGGEIHVDGTIENAFLEAETDIVVKNGVIGDSNPHAHGNKTFIAEIRCNGSFTARFVQNAHITAGSGIFIKDFAVQSHLTAGHQIIVGDKGSRRGDIIGGTARATMLVKANHIGSASYLKTIVMAGAEQALHERLDALTKDQSAAVRKFSDIIKLLELAQLNPGRIPPQTVATAIATRDALNAEIESLKEEEIEVRREIELAQGAQIIALKRVFAGVEISIGTKHFHANKDQEGGTFRLSDGELVFS